MALTKIRGYNVLLTFDGKTIVGTTSDSFNGAGKLKESIEKTNAGQKTRDNIGFDGSISVSAYVYTGTAAGTEMGIKELLTASKTNALGAFILSFGTAGSPKVSGTAYVNGVTVNSNSEDYADCTIELTIKAKPTFGVV